MATEDRSETGITSRGPSWVAGSQKLRPSPAAFPGTSAWSWIRSGTVKTQTNISARFLMKHHASPKWVVSCIAIVINNRESLSTESKPYSGRVLDVLMMKE